MYTFAFQKSEPKFAGIEGAIGRQSPPAARPT